MKDPPCYYCGWGLDAHRQNGQTHPWREGPQVTEADLRYADELTRGAYLTRHQTPIELPA